MSEEKKISILLVEDERNTRDIMRRFLQGQYNITVAEDGERGLNILKKRNFDIVLTDLRMPGADGMAILEATLGKDPAPACIVITAYGSIENAVEAMRLGAFDFIRKPVNFDRLELLLKRVVESRNLRAENQELKERLNVKFGLNNIVGNSPLMSQIFDTVKQVADSRATVLITGESGTGKELIAQAIHQLSGRKGRFIAVNCAALPDNLLESELFGHEKGSFTGAVEMKKGRFELAGGGTLFLDEIGEINPTIQVKLLRALDTRSFERVGGVETINSDCRVLTATNRDLRAMASEGKFREDLFFRLDVVAIELPPLRDRQEDIPILVKHFLNDFASENNKNISGVTEEAISALCAYEWPGNIRELRNCVERMVVLSRGDILNLSNVPLHIRESSDPGINRRSIELGRSSLDIENNEKLLIIKALGECDGNRTKAAKKLGISRRTLHRKLNSYKIN